MFTEDNAINQRVIIFFIEKLGHKIDIAKNGKFTFEKYKIGNYDLIPMDIMMPILDERVGIR